MTSNDSTDMPLGQEMHFGHQKWPNGRKLWGHWHAPTRTFERNGI